MRLNWLTVLACVLMSGCLTPSNVGPVSGGATALSSGDSFTRPSGGYSAARRV